MILKAFYLSIYFSVFVIAGSVWGKQSVEGGVCSRFQGKTVALREVHRGRVKREILTRGLCSGKVLTFYLEQRPVLRLKEGEVTGRVWLEGAIEPIRNPVFAKITIHHDEVVIDDGAFSQYDLREILTQELPKTARFLLPVSRLRDGLYLESDVPASGRYGAWRKGMRFHTALDIPAEHGEQVVAPAPGQVVLISHLKSQSTLFLKHMFTDGRVFFSALAHLKEVRVPIGSLVTKDTHLGRTMNHDEVVRTQHKYNHVHFEVRKNIVDLGNESISVKQRMLLNKTFIDPSLLLNGEFKW